ncbi:MAG: hypothetical protein ABGX24_04080 [Aquificota bacterium]
MLYKISLQMRKIYNWFKKNFMELYGYFLVFGILLPGLFFTFRNIYLLLPLTILFHFLILWLVYKTRKNINFSEWVQTVLTAGENIPQAIAGFVGSMIFLGLIVNILTNILSPGNESSNNYIYLISAFLVLLTIPLLVIILSKPRSKKSELPEPKKVLIGALSIPRITSPPKSNNKEESIAEYLCKQIQYKKIEKEIKEAKDKQQIETIKKLREAINSELEKIKPLNEKEPFENIKEFLDDNIFKILESNPSIGEHSWYPLIKSFIFHFVLNTIQDKSLDKFRIYLLTSQEVKKFTEQFKEMLEIIKEKLEEKIIKKELEIKNSKDRTSKKDSEIKPIIEVITPEKLDKCFLNGLDFNDINHLELYAKRLSDDLLAKGYKDEDIAVNVTGGTVPVSLILTFFAISESRQIEYIHQTTKDLIVLPISPMTVLNLHASPKVIA